MGNEPRTVAPLVLRPLAEPVYDIRFPATPRSTLSDVVALLRRRWRTIALTTAMVMAATTLYCALAPRWYEARATVMIEGRAPELLSGRGVAQGNGGFDHLFHGFDLGRGGGSRRRALRRLR